MRTKRGPKSPFYLGLRSSGSGERLFKDKKGTVSTIYRTHKKTQKVFFLKKRE